MSVFAAYSQYYDLLYSGKDYGAEATYVRELIGRHVQHSRTVLDLGCGTGIHACEFAQAGFQVTGIDRSAEMLQDAEKRRERLPQNTTGSVRFSEGDIRDFSLGASFDVVMGLFHVMSYLTTNADLCSMLTCVRRHLNPGGVLVMDQWYGPGVLTERPVVRVRELENADCKVIRVARPKIVTTENYVDVHYQMAVIEKSSRRCEELSETHRMRYFFQPEIRLLLEHCGFELLELSEWMASRPPIDTTWNTVFAARIKHSASAQ